MHKKLLLCLTYLLALVVITPYIQAQNTWLHTRIEGEVEINFRRRVDFLLKQARKDTYAGAILEINTYGGLITEAEKIRSLLLDFPKPIAIFINTNAASAGALIALACDSIYMHPQATMGSTMVVYADGGAAEAKYQSYMRSLMRATAAQANRDPHYAEAMVDPDIDLDSLAPTGELLSLTAAEARRIGYCEGIASSVDDIVIQWQGKHYYETLQPPWYDSIVALLSSPYMSTVLLMLMSIGVLTELSKPGTGLGLGIALLAGLLYFSPLYITGLLEHWEIGIILLGVALLAAEVFLLPGFGFAGITGLLMLGLGIFLSLVDNQGWDFSKVATKQLHQASWILASSTVFTLVALLWGMPRLVRSRAFQKVTLQKSLSSQAGYTAFYDYSYLIGKSGTALTDLRPVGQIEIEDKVYEAISRGEYIEKGSRIEVVAQDGNRLRVRPIQQN